MAVPTDRSKTPFADASQWNGNEGAPQQTDIKQVDEALNPRSQQFPEWWQKSRLTPEAQPSFDHIMSDAISEGVIKVPFIANGKRPDAAQSLALTHTITTYALSGQGREEMTSVFTGVIRAVARPFSGLRRKSNYEGQEFNQ